MRYRPWTRRRVSHALAFTSTIALVASCLFCACQPQHQAPQQRYELAGKVVAVDTQRRQVTIAHEKIAGYMDAMTMPFSLKDEWVYTVIAAGDRIGAVLVVEGDRSWLEEVAITKESEQADVATAGDQQGSSATAFAPFPAVDFKLTDQDGQPFTLSSLQGKVVVLDFIFTRCPGPCPLLSLKFAQVQKQLGERLGKEVVLVSITIDPRHDTPETLKAYAQRYQANPRGWKFLTGTTKDIMLTASAFGADYEANEEGIVDHRLVTCIIDRQGTVVSEFTGTDYSVEELFAEITKRLS